MSVGFIATSLYILHNEFLYFLLQCDTKPFLQQLTTLTQKTRLFLRKTVLETSCYLQLFQSLNVNLINILNKESDKIIGFNIKL
jgi:hypothetical protein